MRALTLSYCLPYPILNCSRSRPTYHHRRQLRYCNTSEEQRRKAAAERRVTREKAVEENLHFWQKSITPDWKAVTKSPKLRKVWWQGVPTSLRTSMWERAVGNPLTLKKGARI
jgi:hypothetical protein